MSEFSHTVMSVSKMTIMNLKEAEITRQKHGHCDC